MHMLQESLVKGSVSEFSCYSSSRKLEILVFKGFSLVVHAKQ